MKNKLKKNRRRTTTKRLTKNQIPQEDSLQPNQQAQVCQEVNTEIILTLDSRDSIIHQEQFDESISIGSSFSIVENESEKNIIPNDTQEVQKVYTGVQKAQDRFFSKENLKGLKEKGALNIQKNEANKNSITNNENQLQFDAQAENKKEIEKQNRVNQKQKNFFVEIVSALNLDAFNIRKQTFKDMKKIFENNGGVDDQIITQNKNEDQTISVSKNQLGDKVLFDLIISLATKPNDRLKILITQNQDLKTFLRQIKEAMEQNYPNFNGLNGLNVKSVELEYRQTNENGKSRQRMLSHLFDRTSTSHASKSHQNSFVSNLKSTIQVFKFPDINNLAYKNMLTEQNELISSQLQNYKQDNLLQSKMNDSGILGITKYSQNKDLANNERESNTARITLNINNETQQDEPIRKYINKNDRCYIYMESQDIWLEVELNIKANERQFVSTFGIKIDQQTTGKELKRVIQKIAIQIWNQMAADQTLMNQGKNAIKEPDEALLIKTLQNDTDDSKFNPSTRKFTASVNQETRNTIYKPEFYEYFINRVAQLLGADLFYVLTSISVQSYKSIQKQENESIQVLANRYNKDKKTPNQQYRALVAQERQMAGNNQISNEDTLILSGKGKYSLKKLRNNKVLQVLQELVKIGDDEIVMDMFDYERNKIKVDCSFQTIFEYFQTYQNKIYEQVSLVDSLPQVNNVMKSFQDKQFEQMHNQNKQTGIREQYSQISSFQAQAFDTSLSDESNSTGPTKKCNDEQMFIWNLANIDSAIIEKVLIPNSQNKKGSFSGHEKNQQRSKYWAMLRDRGIFQSLVQQGQQTKKRKSLLNQTGPNLSLSFNSKNEIKQARKSGLLDRFFRQNSETKNIKPNKSEQNSQLRLSHNETADFKTNEADNNHILQDKFDIETQKQYKSQQHQHVIESRQISKKSLHANKPDSKQSILSLSPENFQEEFDLMTYLDAFNVPSSLNKNSDLVQKRFMLQNRVNNSILLQSRKEMNNKLLYYRHLLIKNSINLMEKKKVNIKNKNNQFFKALELTNDQINPAIYFQINQIINGELNFPRILVDNTDKISLQNASPNKSKNQKNISYNQIGLQNKLQDDRQSIKSAQKLQNVKSQINTLYLNQIKEADDEAENTLNIKPALSKQIRLKINKQTRSSYQSENSDFNNQEKDSRSSSVNKKKIYLRDEESLSESSEEEFIKISENLAYDLPVRSKSIIDEQNFDKQQAKKFSQESYFIREKPSEEFSLVSQGQRKNTYLTFYKSEGQKSSITSKISDTVMDRLNKDEENQQVLYQQEELHNSTDMFKNDFQPIIIKEYEIQEEPELFKNQIETQQKQDLLEFSYSQTSSKHIKQNIFQGIGSALDIHDNKLGPRTLQVPNTIFPIQNFENNDRQSLKVSRAQSDIKYEISNMQTEINVREPNETFQNQKKGFRKRISKFFGAFGEKKKNEIVYGQNTTIIGTNRTITVPGSPSTKSQHLQSNQYSLHSKYKSESPQKGKNNDLSYSQSLILDQKCVNCGNQKTNPQCSNCKQKSPQTKSILQYFQKQPNISKNDDNFKTNSLANNLFDLSQAAGISHEVFQHVINERINNGVNKSKTVNCDDTSLRIAKDLVNKALILGGGNYLQEMVSLNEEQCKILMNQARNLSHPKNMSKNNQLQQLLVLGYQMQLAMLVPLPDFVLTIEEYQQIKEPPIVNLIYQEVKSNQRHLPVNSGDEASKGKTKRHYLLILVALLIIAILFTVLLIVFLQQTTSQ